MDHSSRSGQLTGVSQSSRATLMVLLGMMEDETSRVSHQYNDQAERVEKRHLSTETGTGDDLHLGMMRDGGPKG